MKSQLLSIWWGKGEWTIGSLPIIGGAGGTKYIYLRVGNDRFWLDTNL